MGRGVLDLEKHYAQYGAYHRNHTNTIIHIILVWPIFFTGLLLLYFTAPFFPFPPSIANLLPVSLSIALRLNFGFFFALLCALLYVCFDVTVGSLGALLVEACWVGSSVVGSTLGFSLSWKVVAVSQFVCWSAQFIGHGVFEKRAPALLENIVQIFLMAPFFVLLEVLWELFGYEPYPGFNASVQTKIQSNVSEWQAREEKKCS